MNLDIEASHSFYEVALIAAEAHRQGNEKVFWEAMEDLTRFVKVTEEYEIRDFLSELMLHIFLVKHFPERFLMERVSRICFLQEMIQTAIDTEFPKPHINRQWLESIWEEREDVKHNSAEIEADAKIENPHLTWEEVLEKDWLKEITPEISAAS